MELEGFQCEVSFNNLGKLWKLKREVAKKSIERDQNFCLVLWIVALLKTFDEKN